MAEDKYLDEEHKVLPIEPWLKIRAEEADGISQLLSHMREVREAVPVNRRLQVELRKKLQERQRELGQPMQEVAPLTTSTNPPKAAHPWLKSFLGVAVALLLVFALSAFWRQANGDIVLEVAGTPQELTRFWTESQPLQPTISPDGNKVLVVRGGSLVLLSETGVQLGSLEPDQGGTFRSPSWSPDGQRVSVVLNHNGSDEIKEIAANELVTASKVAADAEMTKPEGQTSTLAQSEKAIDANLMKLRKDSTTAHYSNLIYSPDGKSLAYVTNTGAEAAAVWIRFPDGTSKQITAGDAPTWSPDGKHLVVQRPTRFDGYELWLVDIDTGSAELLGQGENAVWSNNGYLAFCTDKAQERILTFLPDGEPQYSVRQEVAEIRATYLGLDGTPALKRLAQGEGWLAGSYLLVAPEQQISGIELNWLRQQELGGSQEPKTLVLNELNKCEGQVFSPDAKWLLFARRDGDTVALVKLRLEERWEKRRD